MISACFQVQDCRGHAPKYSEEARLVMRGVLTACRHILAETCSPMAGCADGKDLLPGMLRGSQGAKSPLRHGSADLSGFHVAVLWVGSSAAAVGEPPLAPIALFCCYQDLVEGGLARESMQTYAKQKKEPCFPPSLMFFSFQFWR